MDRTDYYNRVNRRRPVVSLRLPSQRHFDAVKKLAADEGTSVSEWVRRAIADRVATSR